MKTPYDVLGVPRDADDEAIRTALRKAAKVYHPDLNAGDQASEQHLKQVISAYEMLKNPQQRAAYDRYLRNRRRAKVRRFAVTAVACAGVVSGAVLALVVWLAQTREASVPPTTPRMAAAEVGKPASQDVAASDDGGGSPQGDSSRESDWGPAAAGTRLPDDWPRHLQQSTSSLHARTGHPEPQALLAREWGQVQTSGDAMAMWAFVARNPEVPEAELARSRLLLLIDAAEEVPLLHALRIGATGAIAERAQQRLIRLGALVVAREATVIVAGSDDGAEDATPSNDPAFYLARGVLWSRRGDFDRAIADFDEAVRLQPDEASAYSHRGNAWGGKGDQDRALADYEAAIRIDPDNPAAFRDRGILWRRRGDLDRALVDFDQAIRLGGFSDASAYSERGLVWHEKGRHERAIADFNRALRIDPYLVGAFINRGIALRSKGELDRAIADFDQAIRIDPGTPAAYYNRALARSEKHDFDLATADYAKAWELLPNDAAAPAHLR